MRGRAGWMVTIASPPSPARRRRAQRLHDVAVLRRADLVEPRASCEVVDRVAQLARVALASRISASVVPRSPRVLASFSAYSASSDGSLSRAFASSLRFSIVRATACWYRSRAACTSLVELKPVGGEPLATLQLVDGDRGVGDGRAERRLVQRDRVARLRHARAARRLERRELLRQRLQLPALGRDGAALRVELLAIAVDVAGSRYSSLASVMSKIGWRERKY